MNFQKIQSSLAKSKKVWTNSQLLPNLSQMQGYSNLQRQAIVEKFKQYKQLDKPFFLQDELSRLKQQMIIQQMREEKLDFDQSMGGNSQLDDSTNDLQRFVDSKYPDHPRDRTILGNSQMNSWLEKLFGPKDTKDPVDSKNKQKAGAVEENDDEDSDFDDWQGVSREGKKQGEEETDEALTDNDNDDGPDGGEMMPIPEGIF